MRSRTGVGPSRRGRMRLAVAALAAIGCAVPALALAAPPSNDDRASAQEITLPATVTGTTVGSTLETNEPISNCAAAAGSVWYSVKTPAKGTVTADLSADGDLDAVAEVFRRVRSQLSSVACERTDDKGKASLDFRAEKDETYLIRVSQLSNSVEGTFSLGVQFAAPAARLPGRRLPAKGVSDSVDRVFNPTDAYAFDMREGTTYRLNMVAGDSDSCLPLDLFAPGARDPDGDEPVKSLRCGGYAIYTPGAGQGGRYSLVPRAGRTRENQRYHLQAAPVGADDLAPGIFVRNYGSRKGSLRGKGIDVVDLYRFDVLRRSDLNLRLRTHARLDLVLLNETGRRIDCACDGTGAEGIRTRLKKGRYFAAVQTTTGGSGSYTFSRVSRTITQTNASANGRGKASIAPGQSVRLGLRVKPGVSGPATLYVERFDPLSGWQFDHHSDIHVSNGGGSVAFRPPSVGRWRVRASYFGTRTTSPSESGYARFTVAARLTEKR